MSSRPAKHAKVAVWRAFAVAQGMPAKVAAETTKKALLEKFAVDAPEPAPTREDRPDMGPVERAALRDLTTAGVNTTALGAAALTHARLLDHATSGAEAASVGRELRMALATAFSLGKPLSPHSGQNSDGEDGDGVVVGADRLAAARERSANARKGSAR